ncbi:hypothetical protein MNB_SV-6-407 [hydrothermal vent metagenome]|uniref:Glycosyltransferase RgtA/B/C/D-like domain-containing protein n=1 Tax=hydrothermal vent metagenome TaxID=652676 RepID=A0A1W1B977_9ZZZZ
MSEEVYKTKNYNQLILLLIVLFIFILVNRSPVSRTSSDPRGSLLLSQVIIENKSIKLDKYKDDRYGNVVYKKNEHYYYYFPIGTSISSIPFVWFETQILDNDMNNIADDQVAQKMIASVIAVFIFVLLYLIASMYLDSKTSIAVAFIFYLSTSLSSTLGQALWSQDFASLYALLSVYLTLEIIKENRDKYWIPLGLALFMAYLTRPTMSLLSIALILFLFFNNKRYVAIKTAGLVGLLLGLFMAFSFHEFNQPLPDYYLPKRLSSQTFWTAFYGNLFSPARGLFIFSPILFLFIFNVSNTYKVFKQDKTLTIILIWIILHLIIVSKFPHWWAGYSYGARFMTDILPAIFLLLIILLKYTFQEKLLIKNILLYLFLLITIPLSIYFNTIQGLYNVYSGVIWNANPSIDKYPAYLFDWEYPQFLYNKERHEARVIEHRLEISKPIELGNTYLFRDNQIVFIGWSYLEKSHLWSLGNISSMKFKLNNLNGIKGILKLNIRSLGKQEIKLTINDQYVGSRIVHSQDANITFNFDPTILTKNNITTITFRFPDAHKPNNKDPRILAMALKSFCIE